MQIVIDIDNKVYGLLKYFEESLGLNDKKDGNDDVKMALMRAVVNGIPLPDNATNGDVIMAMFPNGKVIKRDAATGYERMIDDKYSYCSWFDGIWWDAPYKAESEE